MITQVAKDLRARISARRSKIDDYKKVFSTPEGQRVLADIYRFCGLHKDPYRPHSFDETARNLGMLRVGQYILRTSNQTYTEIEEIVRAQHKAAYEALTTQEVYS